MKLFSRRIFLWGFALGPIVISSRLHGAQASTDATAEARAVRERAIQYFDLIVRLSKNSPPPGLNASNGHFVTGLRRNASLGRWRSPIPVVTDEGMVLWEAFRDIALGIHNGFRPGLHRASGITYLPLAWTAMVNAFPQMIQIVRSAFAAVASRSPQDIARVVNDIEEIRRALRRRRVVTNGAHANGWISVSVRDNLRVAGRTMERHEGRVTTETGRETLAVLRAYARGLTRLRTEGHRPWLRAEWQAGFQGLTELAARTLRRIG